MTAVEVARPRNRRQLWLLIGLFFAPLLAAFFLYYGALYTETESWRPPGSTNRGELVTPPRPLPRLTLPVVQGTAAKVDFLQGKWTVFYVGNGQCETRCREALSLIRQTRLALNADMNRVQRVFVATTHCCNRMYLAHEHAGLIVVRADNADGEKFLKVFPQYDGVPVTESGRIYISDPLGNLMMSYSSAARPKDLLEDFMRLLKLSHIG